MERAGRTTGEGRIGIHVNDAGEVGAIVELQCESAPVAKTEVFIGLANTVARKVAAGADAAPDPEAVRKDPEVDALFTEVFGKLREAMNLKQCRRVDGGFVSSYVHHDGRGGVLLALDAKPQSDKNIGADLCMHALFTQPLAIDRAGVPAEEVERVRVEAVEFAKAERKPERIIAMIADGKVNAFYAERVLMEQWHVKSDDYGKKRVGDCLKEASVNTVTDLVVMKVGG